MPLSACSERRVRVTEIKQEHRTPILNRRSVLGAIPQELDMQAEEHKEFWSCLMTVCEAQLVEAERQDAMDRAHLK